MDYEPWQSRASQHWREFKLSKDHIILVTTVGQYSLSLAEDRYLTFLYAVIKRNGIKPMNG